MEYNTNPFLSVVQFKQIIINITLTEISCMLLLPRYTSLWSMFLYLFLFQPTEEATVASTVTNRKTALITKTEIETLPFQNPQISLIFCYWRWKMQSFWPFQTEAELGYVEISAQVMSAPLKSLTEHFEKLELSRQRRKPKKPSLSYSHRLLPGVLALLLELTFSGSPGSAAWNSSQLYVRSGILIQINWIYFGSLLSR